MKKKLLITLLVAVALSVMFFVGCVSHPSPFGEVTLHFHYGDVNVDEVLSAEEAKEIRRILTGNFKTFDCGEANAGWGCGYTEDVSIEIGGTHFCPANDKCTGVYDSRSRMMFDLSETNRKKLESIFEAHGGHFPCI